MKRYCLTDPCEGEEEDPKGHLFNVYEVADLLNRLKHSWGCWCIVGRYEIASKVEHSEACLEVQAFMKDLK